jgi:hypothetical protein
VCAESRQKKIAEILEEDRIQKAAGNEEGLAG